MTEERYLCIAQFSSYISPLIDEVLSWGPDAGLDGFESLEVPWYPEDLSGHLRYHLLHTVENCEWFVTLVSQLAAEPPLGKKSLEEMVMDLSPFLYGPLTEIRYMAYQFGPLYMNIVTKLFKYRGGEEVLQAHRSKLFWQNDLPNMTAVTAPKVSALCRELGRKGSLTAKELQALARYLVKVYQGANAILIWAERCDRYIQEPPWVGLVAFQYISNQLQTSLVQFEALWGIYEGSWWFGPDGQMKKPT